MALGHHIRSVNLFLLATHRLHFCVSIIYSPQVRFCGLVLERSNTGMFVQSVPSAVCRGPGGPQPSRSEDSVNVATTQAEQGRQL